MYVRFMDIWYFCGLDLGYCRNLDCFGGLENKGWFWVSGYILKLVAWN